MVLGFKERFADGEATNFVPKIQDDIKVHTIRKDDKGRWKVGALIHFATGVRTKNYRQFGWGVVTKIERIIIYPESSTVTICNGINSHCLTDSKLVELAQRDGFRTVASFWAWFNKKDYGQKFDGVLIHFKYLCDGKDRKEAIKALMTVNIKP